MIIKNVTGFEQPENRPRVNQQRMLPTAVPSRVLGEIISSEPEGTELGTATTATVTIPDASSANITITTTDALRRVLLGVPDVAVYIDSVTVANQWPTASYGGGNMPIYFFPGDWGLTDNRNLKSKLVIRNNTGGARDVIVKYRVRIINNPVGGGDGTNV